MGGADRRTRTVRRGGGGVIRSIDVHAHIMPEETIGQLARQSVRVALKLIPQDDGSTRMEIDGRVVQNPMLPQMFDLDLRLRDMDAYQVDMQLISTNVQTLFYGEEPALAPPRHRDAADAGAGAGGRRMAARDADARFAQRADRLPCQRSQPRRSGAGIFLGDRP